MTEFPWNIPTVEVDTREHPAERSPPPEGYDPCLFVRLRIAHGSNVNFIAIRVNDSDITGEIPFDNGTVLTVKAWGIPTKHEAFMKSSDVMKEIQNYVQSNGLNLR